jgi:hypothetical protein
MQTVLLTFQPLIKQLKKQDIVITSGSGLTEEEIEKW